MRFLAVVVMALLAVPAAAMDEDDQRYCDTLDNIAEAVMERRQDGMTHREMYDRMDADSESLVSKIIDEAYDKPRYQTDEMKEKTVQEFRNRWYGICRRGMSD